MNSGEDHFYNIDAGPSIPALKAIDLFGGNIKNHIRDIDLSSHIANELRETEHGSFLGEFVKNNIVDIAGLVAIFATGPVGAGAKTIATSLGITNSAYQLKEHYTKLSSDKNNTDTDMLVGMIEPVVLLLATKAIAKYIPWLTKLIPKGLKTNNVYAKKASEGLEKTQQKVLNSDIEQNKKHSNK